MILRHGPGLNGSDGDSLADRPEARGPGSRQEREAFPAGLEKAMKRSVVIVTGILLIGCCLSFAQLKPSVAASGNPAPVQMVVTAETYRGVEIPQIAQKDVTVTQEGRNLPVTEWLPLRGENSAMELYLLIDETNDSVMNIHLEQIHEFIDRLPPATAVGVAYMRNGEANVVRTPTTDHNRAVVRSRMLRPAP